LIHKRYVDTGTFIHERYVDTGTFIRERYVDFCSGDDAIFFFI